PISLAGEENSRYRDAYHPIVSAGSPATRGLWFQLQPIFAGRGERQSGPRAPRPHSDVRCRKVSAISPPPREIALRLQCACLVDGGSKRVDGATERRRRVHFPAPFCGLPTLPARPSQPRALRPGRGERHSGPRAPRPHSDVRCRKVSAISPPPREIALRLQCACLVDGGSKRVDGATERRRRVHFPAPFCGLPTLPARPSQPRALRPGRGERHSGPGAPRPHSDVRCRKVSAISPPPREIALR